MQGQLPMAYFLWHESPFPEWNRQCAIQDLWESAHKQLLHAHARWPAAVHFALWPYALRNATHLHNSLPVLEDGMSRLELFSSI
jgi:hypothetical protein